MDLNQTPVRSDDIYDIAGVWNAGQGLFARSTISGSETNYQKLHRLRAGQLVMRKLTAWEGTITTVPPEFDGYFVSPEFPTYTLSPELDPGFMRLICQRRDFWEGLRDASTGTVQRRKRVNPRRLLEIEIDLPPFNEQRRIVDLIAAIDCGTTGSRRLREAGAAARSAVFDRFAEGIGTDLVVSLGAIAEVVSGVTKDEKRQQGDRLIEVPYLRVANVQRGYLDLTEMTTIRVEPARAEKLRLQAGDILFNEGGDRDKLGRGWVWEDQVADCIHQNHVLRARLSTADFDPWFVSIWGNSGFGRQWFELNGSQTTNLASLNLSRLRGFPIPAVPLAEQRRVVDLWMAFDSISKRAGNVELVTSALRTTLLADLLCGDHEIPASYDRFLDGAA